MTKFFRKVDDFYFAKDKSFDMYENIPAGNYVIKVDPQSHTMYLSKIDDFIIDSKLYGSHVKKAERILNTYYDRKNNTGVLLSGTKGSGKTLLTKLVCKKALEKGIPTILVNSAFGGDAFNTFLQQLTQPVIILFDEFEKTYRTTYDYGNEPSGQTSQESILTLLDGVFVGSKLFLFTSNTTYGLDSNMFNRPGRIYYHFKFSGIEKDMVTDYLKANLKFKQHESAIIKLTSSISEFNFDMLKSLVEEINRYDETPSEVLQYLNIKMEERISSYKQTYFINGQEVEDTKYPYSRIIDVNPLMGINKLNVCYYTDKDNKKARHIRLTIDDFESIDDDGNIVFKSGDATIKFDKIKTSNFELERLL